MNEATANIERWETFTAAPAIAEGTSSSATRTRHEYFVELEVWDVRDQHERSRRGDTDAGSYHQNGRARRRVGRAGLEPATQGL